MGSWAVAAIALVCMFVGAMGAMAAGRYLQPEHLSKETQDAVKLGVGMIAAMASLILGLMTASLKGSFDAADRDMHTYASQILALDASLRHYGPDASEARRLLSDYTRAVTVESWLTLPKLPAPRRAATSEELINDLDIALYRLNPVTLDARELRREALTRLNAVITTRWSVREEAITSIPPIFVVVLVTWLTLIFASFGLFAPPNLLSISTLFLCCASIAGALFLILEMSGPFDGYILIQPKPMLDAIVTMEQASAVAIPGIDQPAAQ